MSRLNLTCIDSQKQKPSKQQLQKNLVVAD